MIDWQAKPIEAGQGGDPWRIAVCSLVRYKSSTKAARLILPGLLGAWPLPVDILRAPLPEIAERLRGLEGYHRKARMLKNLAKQWYTGRIFPNKTITLAIERYGK